MITSRRYRGAAVALLSLALVAVGATSAHATPGHPGVPDPGRVVFHEDFENAPHTGKRTMLNNYVSTAGEHYTADPYWIDNVAANGMVLSWNNTAYPADGSGANNGTETTAFNTLRQLSEAIGKINGSSDAKQNTVISAYTQATGTAPAGGKVMFRTVEPLSLADSQGRFLAFSMSAAATNAANPQATGAAKNRQDPQLMLYVDQDGVERPLTTAPINPLTDPRSQKVTVSSLTPGAGEAIRAGQFASDQSFLYEGGQFGVVVRNMTSAHLGNDGAFDDIKILDVTPQLDKAFSVDHATTGDSVRLTFTVTNTAELAEKNGWSFTDSLPQGLVVAKNPNLVVDGAATVTAAPGSGAITVTNGDLKAGDTDLVISLDVTASSAGTYTNGASNITVRKGLDSPGTAKVTFTDPAPSPATLVVRHVDESGKNLADPSTTDGTQGDPYSTAAKQIPGYELVATPVNANGTLDAGTTTVIYVYRPVVAPKTGDLVVKYVDTSGNSLADIDHDSGPVGEVYSTSAKHIEGWTLQAVEGEPNGTFVEGTTTVVYVYKQVPAPASGQLVVRYVDEQGNEVAGTDTSTGTVGDPYSTKAKDVDGYTLKTTPDNASGAYTDTTTQVVYVYSKDPVTPAPAELRVRWIDTDGHDLADPLTHTGVVDEPYSTTAKTFDGYTLVATPTNASGKLTDEPTQVTYVYAKNQPAPVPTNVVVRYVDEQGKPLADPTTQHGDVGGEYTTTAKTIDGYALVAIPANATGTFTESTPDVVYVYKKVADPVQPVDPKDPKDPKDPVTPLAPAAPARPADPAQPQPEGTVVDTFGPTALAQTGAQTRALTALAGALTLGGVTLVLIHRCAGRQES